MSIRSVSFWAKYLLFVSLNQYTLLTSILRLWLWEFLYHSLKIYLEHYARILINSKGNDAAVEPDNIWWPARHDSVISVGAHGTDGYYSKITSAGNRVDIHCPGENVVSTRSFCEYVLIRMTWQEIEPNMRKLEFLVFCLVWSCVKLYFLFLLAWCARKHFQ